MKLLTAAQWLTVFVVMSPIASGTEKIKEKITIEKECPLVKNHSGNWCFHEDPNPTPAVRIRNIVRSWNEKCGPQTVHSEKCEIKDLLKRYHPLSSEVMRVVYSWLYKDQGRMVIPNDWSLVFQGLSDTYFNYVHDDIDRRAIDQAQSYAGVKFHDLAMQAARAANKFKKSDSIDKIIFDLSK